MSGYREHSFDPNAYEQPGGPLRPFNWVQWTGIAVGSVGLFVTGLFLLGKLGWIPGSADDGFPPAFVLLLIGAALVNSRREPSRLVDDAQRRRNRRLLVVTIAICAAILGAALVINSQGA